MMGLDAKTFSSTLASLAEPLTVAKYLMAYLADTVFPAPDSPLTMIDWFLSSLADWTKENNTRSSGTLVDDDGDSAQVKGRACLWCVLILWSLIITA